MSSAAPPLPYPDGGPGGYDNGARRPSAAPNGGGERVFHHLHDLRELSKDGYNPKSSIPQLLDLADVALKQAATNVEFRRPDLAFVEYLRASEIVVMAIPSHRDYVDFQRDHQERGMNKYKVLTRKVNGMDEQFKNIRDIIKNNNSRHGVVPKSEEGQQRVESGLDRQPVSQGNGHIAAIGQRKVKPHPSPKPSNLHGHAITATGAAPSVPTQSDALSARFAQLRVTKTIESAPRYDTSGPSSVHSSPISMPSNADYRGRASLESLHSISSLPGRPQGPRAIPNGLPSLDTRSSGNGPTFNMPQEPKAIYSPARNMQTTGNIAPPRHSARSLESSRRTYSTGTASSASSYAPNGSSQSGEYFPSNTASTVSSNTARQPSQTSRRKSVSMPLDTRIGVERLFDYLERFHILLIDFRTREDFDYGHIYSRNVICIEPLSVRQGMSAEQLQESMVLSPDNEQDIFFDRDRYDLVVYYDRNTQSETYLNRPIDQGKAQLKYLHEALHVFNEDKPLQRPPILLIGGLEAWCDLVGNQALKSSKTTGKAIQGQQAHRRPMATATSTRNSQLRVPKRRVREYNPLNEEEEKYFREQARAESVTLPQTPGFSGSEEQDSGGGEEDDDSRGAIQQFLERFPEAGNIDRYAFSGVMPTREAPQPPAKIPLYPSTHSPSALPSEPARPPPAAPRMSYTGVSEPTPKNTVARSASGAPYIPPKLLANNLRLPRTGLYNFGATCYLNATVQALSATTPLSLFFLDDGFNKQIQRTNWRSNSKGVMAELYSNLIRNLWKGDAQMVKPTTFRKFCGRANTTYENDHVQQDAKEFLEFLLDCLHEDLNLQWSRTPLRALNDKEEAQRERMPKLVVAKREWGRYQHRDLSYVQNLFGGQHLSQLVCQTCHFTSSKYEFFSSLSVEIPDPRKLPGGRIPTLSDCLRSYCSEEILRSGEVWTCPRCKCPRETSKRITITRAPQVLIVHFKRFDHGGSGGAGRKKLIPVDFPLDNLDMSPYMLPVPSADEARSISQSYGPDELKTDESMTPPYTYDAYAVVRHHGNTLSSGHYTTVVKDRARKTWRNFNDSRVDDVGLEQMQGSRRLQSQEAYIVLYQRQTSGMSAAPEGRF